MLDLDFPPPSPARPSRPSSFKASMDPSHSSSSSPHPIRWRKGELIGAGAFGRVYMGMNLGSGELLAVKQVLIAANSVAKEKAQAHVRELEEEVKLLRNLSHPNIVRYLGTAREDDALNIFLEFVPGGSIASLLGKFGSFPEPVIQMYTRQLLQGLQYLHKNGIMHRDIKGANILVDNKGCIKLADFGASKQVVELVTLSGAKSMKGTPFWMAPEVIRQTGHSLPADIWSVGCTVIEMATGKPPWSQQFQEVAALFHIGTTKSHPPIPEHLSHKAQDFLLKCLKKEPHLRPTATDLLQHPFVNTKEYPATVLAPTLISHGIKASQAFDSQAFESSKRRLLDAGSSLRPLEESSVRRSLAFFQKSPAPESDIDGIRGSFETDVNCSVRLDSDSFTLKSFKPTCEPPRFYDPGLDQSSFNPMAEPTSFNPIYEPLYMDDGWGNYTKPETLENRIAEVGPLASTDQQGLGEDSDFSFQCGSADEDDEVTKSKIKAFLDEKALELKRLQTPLYMEYHSIRNVAQQPGDTSSIRTVKAGGTASCIAPLSPAAGRQLAALNSRSPSKASSHSGPSIACSCDSEASVSSDSPGTNNRSVNFCPHVESPRLQEWNGLLQETQQPLSSPRTLNSTEQQRLWKEELQKELEMRREEKRMLSRLAGSTKSSPVSKSASPKERAPPRHAVIRP